MSMDITFVRQPAMPFQIAAWFVMVWPFVAAVLLRRGGRSSAPVLAMLVPIAVTMTIGYAMLWMLMQELAITGVAPRVAEPSVRFVIATARGGVWCMPIIFIVMLLRRHQPELDRVVVLFVATLAIEFSVVMGIGATIASGRWQIAASIAGGIASALTAIAMTVRVILLRAPSAPSPAAAIR